jgi:hypothetical protein
MKIYSDFPLARFRQVVLDAVALVAILLSIWAGIAVHAAVVALAGVGRQLEQAGAGFQKNMSDAAKTLAGIPLVGAGARAPFDSASGAGGTLADAGRSEQDLIAHLASVLGIVVAVIPLYFVVRYLLLRRIRFAVNASRAATVARTAGGLDLLAFRALAGASAIEVLKVSPAPVDGWRRGDAAAIRSLAALELREAGVRLPA